MESSVPHQPVLSLSSSCPPECENRGCPDGNWGATWRGMGSAALGCCLVV